MRVLPRVLPICLLVAGVAAAGPSARSAPLEFNRDIRPILSENCFQCHGQDAAKREGKLRLDDREVATLLRDGIAAIVPGKPDESELVRRITSREPSEMMPPPESHKSIKPAQAALLRQWIAEGAPYQKHWAFEPPVRRPLPTVRAAAWPRTAIDRFVLVRLEREGLAPSREAPPETWLRRASFDLIGLPPTLRELDDFVGDVRRRGESAYAAAVDRLLASPHFGERQALEWLDAARYADTHGFNNDSARTMWRWRDWVIEALNANLPYDRFITEQLAGDLLPRPTLEQRIATGFGRNHVINSEGGIIDEEYRVEYVADRVRTVSTAWLGLTMECARCHDHKFDPVTQRDYYRLYAFFNNVPELGEDGRVANAIPMIPAPTREQRAVLAAQERTLAEIAAALRPHLAAWRWQEESRSTIEARLAAAQASVAAVEGVELVTTRESSPETEEHVPKPELVAGVADPGLSARAFAAAEPASARPAPPSPSKHQGVVGSAWRTEPAQPPVTIPPAKLDFSGKEGLTLALWLRPDADNPRDVALVSSLNHLGNPADSTYGRGRELRLIDGEFELRLSERFPVYAVVVRTEGAAIRPGEWRHVAVTYAGGKIAAAVRVFVDGAEMATRVIHDGLPGEPPKRDFLLGADNATGGARWRGALDELRSFPRALDVAEIHARFQTAALPYALRREAERVSVASADGGPFAPAPPERWLRDALLAEDAATRELVAQRNALWAQHLALRRSLPTAMVMQEMPQPRPAFVLSRGRYDAPTDPVEPGAPESLLAPWPEGAPRNRLGLAQWLTQPAHPLTGRVVVNRFWAQLFGTGLAKTLEDFGSQSEWPSHLELLDRLAREFVDTGWDVKALFKTILLSATYRQSSAVTPDLLARDPENRLLARGPRVRLPAELIRDQALAISGLLVPRLGGPSVHPPQPEKLYEGIVVGAEYPGTKWTLSTGEGLHRRSLYTFWKRTMPHPAMTGFDAPDREFCTVRRPRTNTPLQALTLWNEPGYLEAARQLGARILREGGTDNRARVNLAFRLATGRTPSDKEARRLTETFTRLRADFAAHPDDAAKLINVGTSPIDTSLPPADSAAAMSLASMILSLDETITKN